MSFTIDTIIVLYLLYCVISGWRRGILQSFIGPLSLVLAFLIAKLYFTSTQDIFISFLIGIFGPFILAILLSSLLKLWNTTMDGSLPPLLLSRILGGAFNLCFGFFIIALLLIFIMMMPPKVFKFQNIQEGIQNSYTYDSLLRSLKDQIPLLSAIQYILEVSEQPNKLQELQTTPEFMAVYNDKKIQNLLNDKETFEQMKNKDLLKLLSNPKIHEAWRDKELIKKIIKLRDVLLKKRLEMPSP